jgi:hypothetical protein
VLHTKRLGLSPPSDRQSVKDFHFGIRERTSIDCTVMKRTDYRRLPAHLANRSHCLRRGSLVAAIGAVLVGCLSACGSTGSQPRSSSSYLDSSVVERSIASSFVTERHVSAQVVCPSRIPQRKGHVFQCDARFDVGSYPVPVTETDGTGHVHWSTRAPVHLLKVASVTSAIHHSILTQRGVKSTVSCPTRVLQQKGLAFTCQAVVRSGTAKVKTGTYPFTVTQTDASGHVTYVEG